MEFDIKNKEHQKLRKEIFDKEVADGKKIIHLLEGDAKFLSKNPKVIGPREVKKLSSKEKQIVANVLHSEAHILRRNLKRYIKYRNEKDKELAIA